LQRALLATAAGDLVMTIVQGVAVLALGPITLASTAPGFAQTNGDRMTAGRAAAIRECNRAAAKYPIGTYGVTFDINVYRACMAQHGQQE
jgi:hypothetical protein